jgi:hypothetical protein
MNGSIKLCPDLQVVSASWVATTRGPRDDGFTSGMSVFSTHTSESTVELKL